MRIAENHNHRVQIRLKQHNILSLDLAIEEIQTIREWVEALVEWQPNMYSMNIHSQAHVCDIWFLEERHALLCTLRWS